MRRNRILYPRRLRTPVLPERGEPRRRALAVLLRRRFGPLLDIDAPARAAAEVAHGAR